MTSCKSCGAPLQGCKCAYCGTTSALDIAPSDDLENIKYKSTARYRYLTGWTDPRNVFQDQLIARSLLSPDTCKNDINTLYERPYNDHQNQTRNRRVSRRV